MRMVGQPHSASTWVPFCSLARVALPLALLATLQSPGGVRRPARRRQLPRLLTAGPRLAVDSNQAGRQAGNHLVGDRLVALRASI